jgi:hypothetical protein
MRILNPLTFSLALALLLIAVVPASAEPPAKPPTTEDRTTVIPTTGLFVGNTAELTVGARQIAARWAATLEAHSGWGKIEHHSASDDSDLRLSQARSDSFTAALFARGKKLRLVSEGFGNTRPTKGVHHDRFVIQLRSGKPPGRDGKAAIVFDKDPTSFEGDALFAAVGAEGRKSYRRAIAKHYGLTRKNGYQSIEHGIILNPKTASIHLTTRGKGAFKGVLPMRLLSTFNEITIRGRYKNGKAVKGAYQVTVRGQVLQFFFDKGNLTAVRLMGRP